MRYVMQQHPEKRLGLHTVSDSHAALILLSSWSFCSTRRRWAAVRFCFACLSSLLILSCDGCRLQQSLLLSVVHPGGRELLSEGRGRAEGEKEKEARQSQADTGAGAPLSRLVRAQVLAMRQVSMFLHTSLGRIMLAEERARVAAAWEMDLGDRKAAALLPRGAVRVQAAYALKFAFFLHCEREAMLATELPHLAEYMRKRMKVAFSRRDLSAVAARASSEARSLSPRWLSIDDLAALLADFVSEASPSPSVAVAVVRRSLRGDAQCRMRSQARQQARPIPSSSTYLHIHTYIHTYVQTFSYCALPVSRVRSDSFLNVSCVADAGRAGGAQLPAHSRARDELPLCRARALRRD